MFNGIKQKRNRLVSKFYIQEILNWEKLVVGKNTQLPT